MLDFSRMAARILIIDDDVDTLRLVGLMLQRQGYEISAATHGEQGLAKAFDEKPDLILLDVMMPDMDGYEVARRLRRNPATQSIPILMFTAKTQLDDKVTGFEAGADDYLTKPTHPAELQAHVKALLGRASARKAEERPGSAREGRGRVIGLLAARGGLGVSTLASNLAGALFSRTHEDVILAELTPGQGTLGMDLGLPDPSGLNELLALRPVEITPEKVSATLVTHNSGLKLLLASENPSDVHLMEQVGHFEVLVSRLATLARFTILDLGAGLPAMTQKVLPLCHERIVVTEGMPNTIAHTRRLLDEIGRLGIERSSILVVLNNRIRTDAQLSWADVQQSLGHPLAGMLTPAPEVMIAATRAYLPAVLYQPTNVTSQQILKIAEALLEREQAR